MKKLFFIAISALMVGVSACSGDKKANNEAQDSNAPVVEEVTVVEEQAAPAGDVFAAADALSKKIDAKETLTEADFVVVCDYMIAFYKDMETTTDPKALEQKYTYLEKFNSAFENYDIESLSPEAKAKLEQMQSAK